MRLGVLLGAILITAVVVGGATPVQAQTSPDNVTLQCEQTATPVNIAEAVSLYEQNTDAIPGVVKPLLASNTTKLSIAGAEQQFYTIETSDSLQITDIRVGEPSTYDVTVRTDRETACALATAEQPVGVFQEAYSNGEIQVEGNGVINSARVTAAKTAADIADRLQGLFS